MKKARQGKVWQRSSDNGHQKTFFLYRAILSFYYFLFLYNIGCHGCQRGENAAISRLSGFLPDNQTDNRLDNRSDNGLLFLIENNEVKSFYPAVTGPLPSRESTAISMCITAKRTHSISNSESIFSIAYIEVLEIFSIFATHWCVIFSIIEL